MNQKLLFFFIASLLISVAIGSCKAQSNTNEGSKSIIFSDDFSKDPIGKFPSNWKSNRPGEIITLKSYPGRWFKMHSEGTYLPLLKQNLPKDFTVTFDFIFQAIGSSSNTTEVTLFKKETNGDNDALFPGNSGIRIHLEDYVISYLCYNNLKPAIKISGEKRTYILQENKKANIMIRITESQLTVLVNGNEVIRTPYRIENTETFDALRFHLWGSQAEPLISNFKIIASANQ